MTRQVSKTFTKLLAFFTCCGLASTEIYFKKGAPHVNLSEKSLLSGALHYSRDGRPYSAFIGVPYGQVLKRFEASQPFPLWEGVKSFVKPGPVCPQSLFGDANGLVGEEEGCLNLNVYIPMKNTRSKEGFPVMLWIHGGGFSYGDGLGYGPSFFMDEDVILITINYRLGVFGFLSTGDEVVPGNNGLKDQSLALKWVQEHIQKFGGDRNKITIFGESAGAASVHLQLLSPSTKGLFHRAISQSNSAASVLTIQVDPKGEAVKLASYLKCPTKSGNPSEITSEEIVTCFRNTPAGELNTAQYSYRNSWPLNLASFYFTPVVEAEPSLGSSNTPFLTKSPFALMEDKSSPIQNVPWMAGVTEDEGCSWYSGLVLKRPELINELDKNWDKLICTALHLDKFLSSPEEELILAKKLRKFYFGNEKVGLETRDNLTNLYSDGFITYGVYRSALAMAGREKDPVYLYQYAYRGPVSVFGMFYEVTEEEGRKVGHGDELAHQFILGEFFSDKEGTRTGDDNFIIKPDSEDEKFSKNFVKLWTSFATNGKPAYSWGENSSEKWTPLSKTDVNGKDPLKWLRIESNPGYRTDLYKERMQFWEKIYEEHILPKALKRDSFIKTEL